MYPDFVSPQYNYVLLLWLTAYGFLVFSIYFIWIDLQWLELGFLKKSNDMEMLPVSVT